MIARPDVASNVSLHENERGRCSSCTDVVPVPHSPTVQFSCMIADGAVTPGAYLVGVYLGAATLGASIARHGPSLTSTYLQVAVAGDGDSMQVERLIVVDRPPVLIPFQLYAFPIRLYLVREGPVLTRVLSPGLPIYTVVTAPQLHPINPELERLPS